MAVFGAPVAHDDDPLRAVRAAFDIQQRMSDLSGEVALGEVVVKGLDEPVQVWRGLLTGALPTFGVQCRFIGA